MRSLKGIPELFTLVSSLVLQIEQAASCWLSEDVSGGVDLLSRGDFGVTRPAPWSPRTSPLTLKDVGYDRLDDMRPESGKVELAGVCMQLYDGEYIELIGPLESL